MKINQALIRKHTPTFGNVLMEDNHELPKGSVPERVRISSPTCGTGHDLLTITVSHIR